MSNYASSGSIDEAIAKNLEPNTDFYATAKFYPKQKRKPRTMTAKTSKTRKTPDRTTSEEKSKNDAVVKPAPYPTSSCSRQQMNANLESQKKIAQNSNEKPKLGLLNRSRAFANSGVRKPQPQQPQQQQQQQGPKISFQKDPRFKYVDETSDKENNLTFFFSPDDVMNNYDDDEDNHQKPEKFDSLLGSLYQLDGDVFDSEEFF